MPRSATYLENVWRSEVDTTLRLIADYERRIAGADAQGKDIWETCLDNALRALRSLDRIRDAAGYPFDPRISERLSQLQARTAA